MLQNKLMIIYKSQWINQYLLNARMLIAHPFKYHYSYSGGSSFGEGSISSGSVSISLGKDSPHSSGLGAISSGFGLLSSGSCIIFLLHYITSIAKKIYTAGLGNLPSSQKSSCLNKKRLLSSKEIKPTS